ncbi:MULTISPECIES: phage major tail tube protein [Sphingobium]|uniref:phage major tail tube protein n=1 Tax=Sphingobium TaxID=165695 RepID=UPI0015EC6B05|nr:MULTISPECIES: phage major tail tube protein [Sphingobium]MCW2363532.1 P2 family phage contractile tail tube protein [Sphingobium sp. B10D3B]MCW2403069.1 P2 family phage contractile tail tube protein [Sphingobium sp. B10D7B]MCW2410048.1 P2 family phage contractile tail tube protein [Sphingobium xanthum]
MGLPRTLKNMMLFNEGSAYLGEVKTVTLPTLTRKMEEYRGGGMGAPISLDMGMEALSASFTAGGPLRDALRQFGIQTVDGVYLRFAGAYQQDDSGAVDAIEVVMRGRYSEIEMGDQEVGEPGEFSATVAIAYYKLIWNGRTEIEIDFINMIEIVDGVDRLAAQRNAIGLF